MPAAEPTDTRLRIQRLGKQYAARRVLNALDLEVAGGELVAVLGPSGSGKTTLLRLICGFEQPDAGRIELAGRPVAGPGQRSVPPERRGLGYVAQEGALFPHLDVAGNIAFGLGRRQRSLHRVHELLAMVGLPEHYAARVPSALSGGEQQRVALARALAPKPALVLLDEPFSALDAGLRAQTRAAAIDSLKRAGASAILVTHDQGEALSMGDRLAVLQNGRFAQVATPDIVYHQPVNAAIAHFVGDCVLVPGHAGNASVECCFGQLPLAPPVAALRGRVEVMIRPEQFCVHAAPSQGLPQAQVERLEFYGHDARLQLRMPQGRPFCAIAPGRQLPRVGTVVNFSVAGAVHAYPASAG